METPRASIRINQTGYSAGLPVHAVVTAGGPCAWRTGTAGCCGHSRRSLRRWIRPPGTGRRW